MAPTHTKADTVNKSTDQEITEDRATQTVKRTYSREQLIDISKKPSSKKRPEYLKSIYNNSQGVWDPDLWSQDRKKDHVEEGVRSKRERSDSENQQQPIKKKFGDPKDRLRDEQDGIILSPQRRSFGTGCHVSQAPPSRTRPESPVDVRGSDRDPHREPTRRIGSGRIVNRERDFGNFRVGGKFERDDRDRDRDTRFLPRDGRDRRDLLDRRNNGRYHRVEEEPEWFSDGPTSQHDTIELRGFEDGPEDRAKRPAKTVSAVKKTPDKKPGSVAAAVSASAAAAASVASKIVKPAPPKTTICQDETKQEKIEDVQLTDSDRPPSRISETSTETLQHTDEIRDVTKKEKEHLVKNTDGSFDFDDFFRMEGIPGFFAVNEAVPPIDSHPGLTGSRFGQFFQRECSPPMVGLRDNAEDSRRSSMQDDLVGPFINDPTESSTAASSQSTGSDNYFAPISPLQPERTMSLLEMLQGPSTENSLTSTSAKNRSLDELARSGKAQSVQEIEAGLKSLVMRSRPSEEVIVNSNPRNEEDMSAFQKLVAQVSDGHVTAAASQGLTFAPMDKRNALCEKDILQVMDKHQEMQMNPRMENVLKNAPTEHDLLAGLVKGQPVPRLQYGGLVHHGGRSMPERTLHDDNPLAKLLGQHQSQGVQQQMTAHSGGGPIQRLAPQSQGNSLQQHQREILTAILQQQQQQQQQLRRHPASPMQPPIIQCPPTSPPPVVIQGPASGNAATSPRSHSPHPSDNLKHQQARLHQHQQQQARVPSPLVFGQTPPVISHAPSPIHPSQVAVGGTINPNSLFVQSAPIMPRVLSPQELTLHTQHILQNALIKRKLEEQKENFRKRQEMQGATAAAPAKFMPSSVSENPSANKASAMSPTMASFTPTSVMRKMQAEKDKEAPKSDASPQGLPLKVPARTDAKGPVMGKSGSGGANGCTRTEDDRNRNPVVRTYHGQQAFMNGHLGPVPVPQRLPAPVGILPVVNQGTLQGRPIVKGNQGLQRSMHPNQVVGGPGKQYPATNSNGFDVGKLFEHQRLLQTGQRQMSMSPMPPSVMTQSNMNGRAVAGNPPLPTVAPQPGNAIMRTAMHAVQVAAPQNQRLIDPYQQQAANNRMLQLHNIQSLLLGIGGGSGGRNVAINHPAAPYPVPVVGSGVSAASDVANSGNLAKWFSVDMLRQRMPNMPPVPAQKAMSVEELEQQQQHAAPVHI